MMNNFLIEPLKGFGEIPFGMSLDVALQLLGSPDYYEQLNDLTETDNCSIYYEFGDIETNIYFEGVTKSVVACFETENEESVLYDVKVFELNRKQVKDLMQSHGFKELEEEDEDGEHRITFEDGLIDFFFDGETLMAVSWGVLVNEQGEIL